MNAAIVISRTITSHFSTQPIKGKIQFSLAIQMNIH
jgi:hypothetical protein